MKRLNALLSFLTLTLGNQKGNLDVTEGDEGAVETNYDDYSFDDDSLNELTNTEEVPGDSKTETPVGDDKPDLESQLNDLEVEKPEGDQVFNFLEEANAMGILSKGVPVEFESEDQLKEVISKGFEYAANEQVLADSKTAQEEQFAQREQAITENETRLQELEEGISTEKVQNNVIAQALERFKVKDPEAHAEIMGDFNREMGAYNTQQNNPMFQGMKQQMTKIEQLIAQNNQTQQEKDNTLINADHDEQLVRVQNSWGPKLKALGVKPNWAKVSKRWGADANGTLSYEKALLAEHGDKIMKAMESQNKLGKTKLKSIQRRGPSPQQEADGEQKQVVKVDSYMDILLKSARKHA